MLARACFTSSILLLTFACSEPPPPPLPPLCSTDLDCSDSLVCRAGECVPCASCGDAGSFVDAGNEPDGGIEDAGFEEDAGFDAGFEEDAGVDAGCVFHAGNPPNLLSNPGFECGAPPEGWVPGPGADVVEEMADVYSGLQSARVTATGASSPTIFPAISPVTGNTAVQTYCASAWVKGTAEGTARLSMWRMPAGGGGFKEDSFSQPLTTSWERIRTTSVTTAFDDEITVRIRALVDAGTALLVDEVDLWVSPDGSCSER